MIAVSAALYAAAKAATAFVPTPWGVGQFAPGVVIPAFFAVVASPWVAAIGAGVGVFLGDLFLATTTPLLSLAAGVPANFVGIYLLGWLVARYRSWRSFVWASVLALFVGNMIAASAVVAYLAYLPAGLDPLAGVWTSLAGGQLLGAVFGLTLFWIVTMVPFVIPLVPALVRAVGPLRGRVSTAIRPPQWAAIPLGSIVPISSVVAGLVAAVAAVVTLTPIGDIVFAMVPADPFWLRLLLGITALSIVVFGPLAPALGRTRAAPAALPQTPPHQPPH